MRMVDTCGQCMYMYIIHIHTYPGECSGQNLSSVIQQVSHQLGQLLKLLSLALLKQG